ncbi:MAG: DUF349 domain-containing protein [Muribaculaceae bacterium]|nr:DUF349 domain-containing protein [Muribaculaceae bacterium]
MTDSANMIPTEETTLQVSEEKNVHSLTKEEIAAELRRILEEKDVNAHKEVTALKQALFALRQREINEEMNSFVEAGGNPTEFSATPDETEAEAKELIAKFREMRTEYLEAEEKRLEANLEKKKAIVAEMKSIVEDADNVNQHFPRFQELQKEFRDIKEVTPSGEAEIWKEFQQVSEQFYDTLKINKELRDLDFKKNLEAKRRLIEETIALQQEEVITEASRKLQQLHAEWREIGPVVKELRESIWEEFKEASSIIHRKHQEFFDRRKEEEKNNEDAKTAICEEIENLDRASLTTFTAWEEMSEKVKELQAKWRTIGYASRKVNNELYARYRKACDDFFEAKSAYISEVKANLQSNYEKKVALSEKAESLKDAENLSAALEEVQRLQEEWKKIGSVPRKLSDAVWERFSGACRAIYDRKRKVSNERHNLENANLKAKREVIAALKEIPTDIDRREGLRQVKELQNRWNETGHVPYKMKDQLYADYRAVCDTLYGAFNTGREQERRKNFNAQLDTMKGDNRKLRSERDRLMRVLEAKQQELKTYNNNLGFFNIKSAQGNSMLKDMERKMQRIENDIKDIRAKIDMIAAEEK